MDDEQEPRSIPALTDALTDALTRANARIHELETLMVRSPRGWPCAETPADVLNIGPCNGRVQIRFPVGSEYCSYDPETALSMGAHITALAKSLMP